MDFLTSTVFILLLIVVKESQNDEAFGAMTEDGCFIDYQNTKLQCATPFELCPNVNSPDNCRKICLERQACTGVQYQISTKQCSLFDGTLVIGNGSKLSQRIKREPYVQCGYRPPFVVRNQPDYCFSQKTDNPACGMVTDGPVPPLTLPPAPPPSLPPTAPPVPQPATTLAPMPTAPPIPMDTSVAQAATTLMVTGTPATVPLQPACPSGQSVLVYQYSGYQLQTSTPGNGFVASDENACIQACINNQLPDGTAVSCQSTDFNNQTSRCQIYSSASPPIGSDKLSSDASTNHYEKICVDSVSLQSCQQGKVIILPQKVLVGFAETVITSPSRQDCIFQCLNSVQRFGFKCASGSFYTNEASNNCILNSESAASQPTLLDDESDLETYFEPLCQAIAVTLNKAQKSVPQKTVALKTAPQKTKTTQKPNKRPKRQARLPTPIRKRNVIWPHNPNWGSWTRCDALDSKRRHYRNCRSFNPNSCEVATESCDPRNRTKELEEIANEEKRLPLLATPRPHGPDEVNEQADGRGKGKWKGRRP